MEEGRDRVTHAHNSSVTMLSVQSGLGTMEAPRQSIAIQGAQNCGCISLKLKIVVASARCQDMDQWSIKHSGTMDRLEYMYILRTLHRRVGMALRLQCTHVPCASTRTKEGRSSAKQWKDYNGWHLEKCMQF